MCRQNLVLVKHLILSSKSNTLLSVICFAVIIFYTNNSTIQNYKAISSTSNSLKRVVKSVKD